jgi:hypothetical protein
MSNIGNRPHRLLLRQQLAQEQPPRVQRLLEHDQRLGHEQYREPAAQASHSSAAGSGTAATCSATPNNMIRDYSRPGAI